MMLFLFPRKKVEKKKKSMRGAAPPIIQPAKLVEVSQSGMYLYNIYKYRLLRSTCRNEATARWQATIHFTQNSSG